MVFLGVDMINHALTLLLNERGESIPAQIPGDVYIPPFKPVDLPAEMQEARDALFTGVSSFRDRRYRALQLIRLVHATDLAGYIYDLDPRVTYSLVSDKLSRQPMALSVQPSSQFMRIDAADTGVSSVGRYTLELSPGVSVFSDSPKKQELGVRVSREQFVIPLSSGRAGNVSFPGSDAQLSIHLYYPPEYVSISPVSGSLWDITWKFHDKSDEAGFLSIQASGATQFDPVSAQYMLPDETWSLRQISISNTPTGELDSRGYRTCVSSVNLSGYTEGTPVRLSHNFQAVHRFSVSLDRRLADGLRHVFSAVGAVSSSCRHFVFGRPPLGHFRAFDSLFDSHPLAAHRLSCFVLAYVHRLSAIRE